MEPKPRHPRPPDQVRQDFGLTATDEQYRGWQITPKMLDAETGIRWFRFPHGYRYARETLLSDLDHGREIDPLREIQNGEILGIAKYQHRYIGPRRIWYLMHEPGYLDGVDVPVKPDLNYSGFVVPFKAKETTVRHREYSPLGVEDRELSPAEIAEAIKHRDHALATWAADAIENERRIQVRAEWLARKEAEARSKYKLRVDDD